MTNPRSLLLVFAFFHCSLPMAMRAGIETTPPLTGMGADPQGPNGPNGPKELVEPISLDNFSGGGFTFAYQGSEHLNVGYVDSFTPLWKPGNAEFFLDTRSALDDESRYSSSYGLGFRYLFPDQKVIIGANVFYDDIHSPNGNDFNQLGLGAEVLSKWVDARFNYYLPDHNLYEVGRSESVSDSVSFGPLFFNGPLLQQRDTITQRVRTISLAEGAMQGLDTEVGFLLPGLDRYMQVRAFAGAYHFDNPVGPNYSGFKARLEARVLPGVTLDAAYFENAYLNGGTWTAGVRVSVPFSIGNLFTGRNPFEGFTAQFRPGPPRDFSNRMNEPVLRFPDRTTATGWDPSGRINGAMEGKGSVLTVKTATVTETLGKVTGFQPANVVGSLSSGTFSGGLFDVATTSGGSLTIATSQGGTLSGGALTFSGASLSISGGASTITAGDAFSNKIGGGNNLVLNEANVGTILGLQTGGTTAGNLILNGVTTANLGTLNVATINTGTTITGFPSLSLGNQFAVTGSTLTLGNTISPTSLNGTFTFTPASGLTNVIYQGQSYLVPSTGGTLVFTSGVVTGGTLLNP